MSTNDKNVEATARKDTGAMPELELIAAEEREDRRALRVAMGIAVALHAVLLVTQFPALTNADPLPPPEEDEPFVIQEMRIKPPPPPPPEEEPPPPEPQVERPAPKPEVRKVPIPHPTPDEPEPPPPMEEPPPREPEIVEPVTPRVVERAPVALPSTDALVSIPDPPPAPPAPPPPPPEPEPQGPIMVGGDVRAPEKISGADPQYPEVARQARVEGVVIVKAVIDKRGRVQNVEIVKDLSMGLGKSAAAAVRNWRFRPATLHGKPVDVYYNLTVHFSVN